MIRCKVQMRPFSKVQGLLFELVVLEQLRVFLHQLFLHRAMPPPRSIVWFKLVCLDFGEYCIRVKVVVVVMFGFHLFHTSYRVIALEWLAFSG